MPVISRRNLIQTAASVAGAMAVGGVPAAIAQSADSGPRSAVSNPLDSEPSLREAGRKSGIPFGLAENPGFLAGMKPYFQKMFGECNVFTPGNQFRWNAIEVAAGTYNDVLLNQVISAASAQDVGIVGHTLLWYPMFPEWLKAMQDEQAIARATDGYVERMVDVYRGKVVRWDVINEQIRTQDKRSDGLRKSFLLEKLGPDYIERAFEVARRTDPKVKLCYNEFGIEYRNEDERQKRDAFLKLLRRFRDKNAPVDVVGLQSHLDASKQLDIEGFGRFVSEVRKLGYEIAITELDVLDKTLPADEAERDARVAAHVDQYLDCVFSQARPTTLTCWGFADRYTWLTMWHKRADGRQLRPLPFDNNLSRKPLWATIRKFLV